MFPARTDLNGIITMLLTSLVGDDLDAVELQNGAGDALAGFRVEDSRHALLDSDCTGSKGKRVGFASKSGGGGGFEDGQVGVVVEATGLGGIEGSNAKVSYRDMGQDQLSVPEGLGELE